MSSQCRSVGAAAREPGEAGAAHPPEWEPWLAPRETQQTLRVLLFIPALLKTCGPGERLRSTHPLCLVPLCWYAGPRSYLPEVVLDCFVVAVCEPLRVLGVAVFIPVGPKEGH